MTTALAATGQAGIAQSQRAAQDVQEQSRQIDSLKHTLAPAKDKAKKLREACEGFESVFIQKMWEQMRATVPKGGMLQGRDEHYWQGMFDQELSKKMSSAGGIGLADMMYEQLSRNLVSASRTTASALGAAGKNAAGATAVDTGFVASAAPLLPPLDSATAQAGEMYSAEARQPEANLPDAQSQSADTGLLEESSKRAAQEVVQQMAQQKPPASSASPVTASNSNPPAVQQVLDQLRAQAEPTGVNSMGSTMTGAQAIAAVQAMTPAQALALSQGMSWSQVQNMNGPAAETASGAAAAMGATLAAASLAPMPGSGLDAARSAAQIANTRMPASGVLPPMTPMQRQSQIQYSAAKVTGNGGSSHNKSAPPPAGAGPLADSTMPANPVLHSNVQGNPGINPGNFVQNSSLIPQANSGKQANKPELAANTAPMSMTAEQIAAMAANPQPSTVQGGPGEAPKLAQAATSPAVPATAQEAQVINTTFTTNVPPKRRAGKQGQRVAKGAAIRTLNAG